MSIEELSPDAAPTPTTYLTHGQALALLEAVARSLECLELASASDAFPLTPSHMPALVSAMESVGVDPAIIHAYRCTGVLVSEGNEDLWSAGDLRRWAAAVRAYRIQRAGRGP